MIAIATAALLMQAQVPQDYFDINSVYARACSNGALAARAGRYEPGALVPCAKAIESEPLNALGMAQTLVNRGAIRFAGQDRAGALADFNAAIAKKPDFAVAYSNRAGVYMLARDFERARADADRAVQLDGGNARAFLMRGGANEMLGKTVEAYLDYQMAAKLDPAWEQPKTELARFRVK
ncbi:MAG: tetratricopeptide repeat protein [Caulobacteraceae bacterium]|nr:tetratricopeptide repeat protein [Caulobacteraceae bacterium]